MEVSLSSPSDVRRQRYRNRSLTAAAMLLVVAALVGCSDDDEPVGPGPLEPVGPVGEESGIPGSGNVVSEARDVGAFTAIVFDSEGTVVVSTGEEVSLVVEADDNLQQYLTASVIDNVLEVSTTEGIDIAPSQPPVFRIGVGSLTAVDLAGVGTIDVSEIEATRLDVTLSGVGDVTINPVAVGELVLDLHGPGTATFAGSADRRGTRGGACSPAPAQPLRRWGAVAGAVAGVAPSPRDLCGLRRDGQDGRGRGA